MQVEFCKSFGDPTKPRAWSKHAQKPSQSKQPSKNKDSVSRETKKVRRRSLPPTCSVSRLSPLGEEGQARERRDDPRIPLQWFLKAGSPKAPWFRLPSPFLRDPHCLCPLFSGRQEEKGSRRTGEGEFVLSKKRRAVSGGCSRPRLEVGGQRSARPAEPCPLWPLATSPWLLSLLV